MSSRLPSLRPKEFIRALEKLGFVFKRQTGSHAIYRNPQTKAMASVPIHPKDLKRGLVLGVLNRTGVLMDDFLKALK